MKYPPVLLARFTDLFAELFTDRGTIRTVIDEAGIEAATVNLEQESAAVWNALIRQANLLGKLRSLLTVAQRRYPTGDASLRLGALEAGMEAAEEVARYSAPSGKKKQA